MPGVRLTADQRLVIERVYLARLDQVTIAALVGKHPSTISREQRRAGSFRTRSPRARTTRAAGRGYQRKYSAKWSQREAARKARRPNGLLHQYWPKGADLRHLTVAECDQVALKLNTRPRKTLEWQTPSQALNQRLVATAV